MEHTEFLNVVDAYETANDCDLLLYSGAINRDDVAVAVERCHRHNGTRKNVAIFLTTLGGDPDAAYRLAHALQKRYERVRLLIGGPCKSAGTLMAVGADEVAFGIHGELGPLDIQLHKPNEIDRRTSGLDILQALEAVGEAAYNAFVPAFVRLTSGTNISARMAADIASNLVGELYKPISAQIDPFRVGESQRAMEIAEQYGRRLSVRNKLRPAALHSLIRDYPSHGFVIDADEATKYFPNVSDFTDPEASLADYLNVWVNEQQSPTVFVHVRPALTPPGQTTNASTSDSAGTVDEQRAARTRHDAGAAEDSAGDSTKPADEQDAGHHPNGPDQSAPEEDGEIGPAGPTAEVTSIVEAPRLVS